MPAQPAAAAGVVGTGTPESCTEAAFDAALVGGGEVTFNCGAGPFTLLLTTQKTITIDTTIDGGGKISLSGQDSIRLFYVSANHRLDLHNLTLMNGSSSQGGAILNDGYVAIGYSSLLNNASPGAVGGAIYNYGTLAIGNSTFSGNTASAGLSGAIQNDGVFLIMNSTFSNNFGGLAGGAIGNSGTASIQATSFAGNQGPGGGGAINNSNSLLIVNSTFQDNTAISGDGGGIYNSGSLALFSSTFYSNTASTSGGGVYTDKDANVETSTFVGNSASLGGGIYNSNSGNLSVDNSTFDSNLAPGGQGGGIYNMGVLTMSGDTFTGNEAGAGLGGGVSNAISGTLTVANSTFSDNFGGLSGGGIISSGAANITNCTFYNNTNGGLVNGYVNAINVKNTIIANNTAYNCSGPITSAGYNLEDGDTCTFTATGDLTHTVPLLEALADNGGPTWTHALLPDSPAINAGTNTDCPATDQRGIARPFFGTCDIGAYEFVEQIFLPLVKK